MRVRVVRQVKSAERRVTLTRVGAHELIESGYEVVVEREAGVDADYPDAAYLETGARIELRATESAPRANCCAKPRIPSPPSTHSCTKAQSRSRTCTSRPIQS